MLSHIRHIFSTVSPFSTFSTLALHGSRCAEPQGQGLKRAHFFVLAALLMPHNLAQATERSAAAETSDSSGSFEDQSESPTRRLDRYYSSQQGYNRVYRRVMEFFGTIKNGCVAFMGEALRQTGVPVPFDYYVDGYSAAYVTSAFAAYLQREEGWKSYTNLSLLEPGDIVFTVATPDWPGVPSHTFMFHKWLNKGALVAQIVDNQGFLHARYLKGNRELDQDPSSFALYKD